MDDTYITIILALVGAILIYIFKMINTLFNKLDDNKKECEESIEKSEKRTKDHYATIGHLETLEATLMGRIDGLIIAIDGLSETIKSKL